MTIMQHTHTHEKSRKNNSAHIAKNWLKCKATCMHTPTMNMIMKQDMIWINYRTCCAAINYSSERHDGSHIKSDIQWDRLKAEPLYYLKHKSDLKKSACFKHALPKAGLSSTGRWDQNKSWMLNFVLKCLLAFFVTFRIPSLMGSGTF